MSRDQCIRNTNTLISAQLITKLRLFSKLNVKYQFNLVAYHN